MTGKTLILLRHAKAARGAPDHDRALDPTGRVEAAEAGRTLAGAGLRPRAALVSDARRTRDTFDEAAGLLGPVRLAIEPDLYEASAETILALVRAAPEADHCLLVVGHNPGLGEAARLLATDGPGNAMAALARSFPTGASAVIDFDGARWSDLAFGSGRLRALLLPAVGR